MSKRNRRNSSSTNVAEKVLKMMFMQGKAQFGDAVKGFWLYDGDLCPACLQNPAGVVNFEGKEALSINVFMYRERGILIGYFLCEKCTLYIHEQARKHPYQETPLHAKIEANLRKAYHEYLNSLN